MNDYELLKTFQIDGEFQGFDDEMLFKLSDGTYWIQDQYMYWYHYAYCPKGSLLRANGRLYLKIDGQDQTVPVRQIVDVVEAQISGDFNGWEGETTYKLTNGQVWQQCTYHYEYSYSYSPEAMVYSVGGIYKMKVEGTTAEVRQVK